MNVNVRSSVIYILHRLSQNSCVITELLRWRVGHFEIGSVMPLINISSMFYSGYEVKFFYGKIYNQQQLTQKEFNYIALRACNLVVSDLRLETKGSRFVSSC